MHVNCLSTCIYFAPIAIWRLDFKLRNDRGSWKVMIAATTPCMRKDVDMARSTPECGRAGIGRVDPVSCFHDRIVGAWDEQDWSGQKEVAGPGTSGPRQRPAI